MIVKKRETWIQVRFSGEEKKMVEEQAKRLGLTISAYIRMLIYQNQNEKGHDHDV